MENNQLEQNTQLPDYEALLKRSKIQPISDIRYQPEPNIEPFDYMQLLYLTGKIDRYRLNEVETIASMLKKSFMVTARQNQLLVATARYISDSISSTFVAEILVREDYRNAGIGMSLIKEIIVLHPNTDVFYMPTEMSGEYIPLGIESMRFNAVVLSRL